MDCRARAIASTQTFACLTKVSLSTFQTQLDNVFLVGRTSYNAESKIFSEATMDANINPSSEESQLEKALESLRRTELLQRDWMIWGVNGVYRHVEDLDGDWLEKWGEEDEEEPENNTEISQLNEETSVFRGEHLVKTEEIDPELKRLSSLAASVEPGLANRLEEMRRWIKDKKPGLLTSKKFVIDFLGELIEDAQILLDLASMTPEERQVSLDLLTSSEKYWYNVLFPKWLNEPDPKLFIWKQKMMAGEFTQDEATLFDIILYQVGKKGGSGLRRYIIDLSMATDLIVSGNLGIPLCVQLTTISRELSIDKKQAWEVTLRYWGIERGLFVSFNPGKQPKIIDSLADEIFRQSDGLASVCYSECSVDG